MNIMINESHCVNVKNETKFILIAYIIMKITPRSESQEICMAPLEVQRQHRFQNSHFFVHNLALKPVIPSKSSCNSALSSKSSSRLLSTRWTSTFSKTLLYWVGSLIPEPPSSSNFPWLDACLLWHTPIWWLEMTSSSFGLEWGASQHVTIPTLHEVR